MHSLSSKHLNVKYVYILSVDANKEREYLNMLACYRQMISYIIVLFIYIFKDMVSVMVLVRFFIMFMCSCFSGTHYLSSRSVLYLQATTLLTMDKYSMQDVQNINNTCFKLNSLQLNALMSNYHCAPDEPYIPPVSDSPALRSLALMNHIERDRSVH